MAYTTEQIAEMIRGAKAEEYGFVEAYDCSLAGYEYPDGLNLEEYCVADQGADCWIQVALDPSNNKIVDFAISDERKGEWVVG